jgi:hypothetical protein
MKEKIYILAAFTVDHEGDNSAEAIRMAVESGIKTAQQEGFLTRDDHEETVVKDWKTSLLQAQAVEVILGEGGVDQILARQLDVPLAIKVMDYKTKGCGLEEGVQLDENGEPCFIANFYLEPKQGVRKTADDQKEYQVSWKIDVVAGNSKDAVTQAVSEYMKPEEPERWAYHVQEDGSSQPEIIEGIDIAWPDHSDETSHSA